MCSTAGLFWTQAAMSMMGSYNQYRANRSYAEQQRDISNFNANISARRQQDIAENYGRQEQAIDQNYQLVRGQNIAEAGAANLDFSRGSMLDVLNASYRGYLSDRELNQRNQQTDVYNEFLNEQNYRLQAKEAEIGKQRAKWAGIRGMANTAIGTYLSYKGMRAGTQPVQQQQQQGNQQSDPLTPILPGQGGQQTIYRVGNPGESVGPNDWVRQGNVSIGQPMWRNSQGRYVPIRRARRFNNG